MAKEASIMGCHFPYSYEQELKEQVAERLAAFERIHRADAFDRGRPHTLGLIAGRVGEILVRLGTWLEQPSRSTERVGG
jgi:hypothetical protein